MPKVRTYGLDIDTIAYAARVKAGSGKTILPENLKQLNKFIVGIKKLGLWNTMVCWPMRSIHNAGTGTTVYSLGGLGIYNGTLFNLIEWNFEGLLTPDNANSGFCRTTSFRIVTQNDFPITIFAINKKNGTGISNNRSICQIGTGTNIINLLRTGAPSTDSYTLSMPGMTNLAIITSLNESNAIYANIRQNDVKFNVNFGTTLTATPALATFTTNNTLILSVGSPTGSGNNICSVVMLFLTSEVNQRILHDLYKRTIGQGIKVVY